VASWRRLAAILLATLGLATGFAAGAAELRQGKEFRVISPPLLADRQRIEVTEFFWYGCPHCFDFEPVLAQWARALPPDAVLRRVPAIFPNDKWAPGARLYYTLEALNLLDRLHAEVFNAIHVARQRLDDEKILFEWIAAKGVDMQQFTEAWSSFAVASHVQQARATTRAAGITGVPAVMVHGRYVALMPGSYGELTAIIDGLIDRVRVDAGMKKQ